MKKIIAVVALSLGMVAVASAEPIGYPGSAWFIAASPSAPNEAEKHNNLYQGKIEQGIDWAFLDDAKKFRFNTYMSVAATADSAGLVYNNKYAPAVGARISYDAGKNTRIDFGVQEVYENRWVDKSSASTAQVYISIWSGWNLK